MCALGLPRKQVEFREEVVLSGKYSSDKFVSYLSRAGFGVHNFLADPLRHGAAIPSMKDSYPGRRGAHTYRTRGVRKWGDEPASTVLRTASSTTDCFRFCTPYRDDGRLVQALVDVSNAWVDAGPCDAPGRQRTPKYTRSIGILGDKTQHHAGGQRVLKNTTKYGWDHRPGQDYGWDHRPGQEASSNPTLTLNDPQQRTRIIP